MRFNATARENVRYGDVDQSVSDATLRELAAVGGADEVIDRLPESLETMLGRSFAKGAELSGGEWQRIAATRSLVRDAAIVVMDEPTSAMDPWSEQGWLQRIKRFAEGRTVILITHRLTTAMGADRICVMEQGAVVQQGTHSELLVETNGSYAKAWRSVPIELDPTEESA